MAHSSCLLSPPTWGSPLQSRNPGLSLPSRPEAVAREGPTLPSVLCVHLSDSFNFSVLAAPTSWPINIFSVISKTNLKKKKTVKQVEGGEQKETQQRGSKCSEIVFGCHQNSPESCSWPGRPRSWTGQGFCSPGFLEGQEGHERARLFLEGPWRKLGPGAAWVCVCQWAGWGGALGRLR